MKKLLIWVFVLLTFTTLFSASAFAENESANMETIKSIVARPLEEFYYHKIEGNETGFIIQIAEEGLSLGAVSVLYGFTDRSEWEDYVNVTLDYANSISDLLIALGIENPNVLFIVLDDLELKSTLLAIYNGKVIYDFTYTNINP